MSTVPKKHHINSDVKETMNRVIHLLKERAIPSYKTYMQFISEKFLAMYTAERILRIDEIIKSAKSSSILPTDNYQLNTAIKMLVQERKNLFDILLQIGTKIGKNEVNSLLLGIQEKLLTDDIRPEQAEEIRNDNRGKINKDIDFKYSQLEETERLIGELTYLLYGSSQEDPELFEDAINELNEFKKVYSPETNTLAKYEIDTIKALESKWFEVDRLQGLFNVNADAAFDSKRVKENVRDISLKDRKPYRKLLSSFKNIKRACKHLKRYRLQLLKHEQLSDKSLNLAASAVDLAPAVAKDLGNSMRYMPGYVAEKKQEASLKKFKDKKESRTSNFKLSTDQTKERIKEVVKINKLRKLSHKR